MSLPQHPPLRTSSPRRPAPATGGGSTSGSGGGGGGGGSTSGGPSTSSIPAVALASPKRKRSDPDHTRSRGGSLAIGGGAGGRGGGSSMTAMAGHTAGAAGLNMSGGIGIGGLPLGPQHHPGASTSSSSGQPGGGGIFVPQHMHHRHGGGRQALNRAASWDAAATDHQHHHHQQDEDEFGNSNAAAAYHDDGDESQYPYLDHNGGNDVASAVVVGHPPPSVRKARRRSSSGQGDEQVQQMQVQQQIGGAMGGGRVAGTGGAATSARPSTAPAAMTPARGDGLGRAQVPVCPSSAAGAGASAGTSSSSGHYWTRSKPYPPQQPQQQQQQQQLQQNMPSLFSPGVGGPPPPPSNANAAPPPSAVKPPAGKHHHHHSHEGDEEQTASTKSTINLSSDSSLLPGSTPIRGGRGDRSASSKRGGGDHPTTTSGFAGVEQQQQVPSSPAATFGFASFPASLPRLHALPPRTQPTPGGGGGGGFGSGTGGTGGAGTASRTKVGRIDESEAWTTASASATNAAAQAPAAFDGSQPHHPRSYTSSSSALPPTHSAHRRPQSPNTSIDTMNDSTVSSISIDHGGGGGGHHQQQGSQSLHRQTRSDGTGSSSLRGGRWLDEDDGEGGGGGRKSQQQHEEDEEIGRTRLDFSSLLSPEPKASRKGGSKQKHGASAPSAAPAPFASFGRTSFGGEGGDAAIGHRIVDESGVPLTPGAATLRFQLDEVTKCSPIPNGHHHGEEAKSSRGTVPVQPPLLEGQGDGPAFSTRRRMPLVQRKSVASDAKSSVDGVNTDEEMQTRSPSKPSKTDPELSALSGVTASSSSETSTVHGSVGNGSHNTGGSSSKKSKARPMPDMSAFDGGGGGDGSPSSGGDGMAIDPSSPHVHPHPQHGASGQSGPIPPPSPYKLVCPPTPQRTPVWAAHADPPQTGAHGGGKRFNLAGAFGPTGAGGKLARADSLIATKVLAECPPQILDGFSSLENSLLDDADKSGGSNSSGGAGSGAAGFHGSGDLTASLSACLDDEGHASFGQQPSGTTKPLTPIGEAGSPGSPGGGMMDYDENSVGEGSSASPRRNLSLMDDMLDDGDSIASPRPRRVTQGAGRREAERTPHQKQQRQEELRTTQISFNADFENLGQLGSGAFADVYKVRSKADGIHYAIKRNRRQFRGKRDRDRAMAEVRVMQRLQTTSALQSAHSGEKSSPKSTYCLYLLFFIRAWQEDGYFFCQTELCCRDTCRQLMESLSTNWNAAKTAYPSLLRNLPSPTGISPGSADTGGRSVPESTIWKICHDVCAGLSHIHSHGMVHQDVKPSNIFFVSHVRLGVLCKIGDFGMAGEIGVTEDGQEGDTAYMAPELLSTSPRHASADIFSLGLTIYELACARVGWRLPNDGQRWHDLRNGDHAPELPPERGDELSKLIRRMTSPDADGRPSSGDILDDVHMVRKAGTTVDQFLTDYVKDVDEFDKAREEEATSARRVAYERRMTPTPPMSSVRPGTSGSDRSDRSMSVRTPTPDSGLHMLHGAGI